MRRTENPHRSTLHTRALLALLVICCARANALDRARSLNQFAFQTWQTGSGLPQNTIHSVLQTRDGYLWIATEGGLVRFDGYKFRVFDKRSDPILASNNIQFLLEDQVGTLWVATGGGLYRREGNSFVAVIPGENILSLQAAPSGEIWAVGPGALLRISTKRGQSGVQSYSLAEGAAKLTGAMASENHGSLWLGTQTGLVSFHNGHFTTLGDGLVKVSVNALLIDRKAKLWVGTAKGLVSADARTARTFQPEKLPGDPGAVLTLFEDWEGALWVGGERGLARVDTGNPLSSRALPGSAVIAISQDAERDLWVGTESDGLTVVRNPKFVTYTSRDGLSSDAVRCVFESSRGVMSMGTNRGVTQLVRTPSGTRIDQLTTANGLSSNVVLSLSDDRDGNLLIGTPDGLNRIHRRRASVITSADGLADDFIRSIYRDRDGSLWIGTRHGLSHEVSPGQYASYTQADGLGSDLVGAILRDRHGTLWAGTLNGLTAMREGAFTNYTRSNGLSSNTVTALHEDVDSDLWIGTQDGGLNLLDNAKIRPAPKKFGLPEAIYGIAEDDNGEFWLSSNAGIVRVNRSSLKAALKGGHTLPTVVWYGTSDGLQINECSVGGHPETWKAQDGTLWFSTLKGVAALGPDAARLNHVLPPVVIESITVDSQVFAPAEAQEIGPGHSRLAFTYAGLSFAAPQKVIYRYKLEGFDKDWVEAGTQRTASYTNIPPGTYAFRVLARNNDGFWSATGAVTRLHLQPRFVQTFWFYLLVAGGLALCAYIVYRWRVTEVHARFDAVLQERNRIAREIHDTLAQGFVGVSVQLEIVSRLLSSSTETAREHLDQARLQVRESIGEARRSIWQLRSQASENGDLAARLSKAATQVIGSQPVKFSLDVHGINRPLTAQMEDEFLRIGQEAVTNAMRHGDPKRINIELAFTDRKLRMRIADDGRGFSAGVSSFGPNGHFGLKGMRERAQAMKAKLVVDSAEGKGTEIIVEAPLN